MNARAAQRLSTSLHLFSVATKEHLRLGRARVAKQQYVDVPPNSMLGVHVFGTAAEETEGDGRLHVLVSVYRRRDGADDPTPDLFAVGI